MNSRVFVLDEIPVVNLDVSDPHSIEIIFSCMLEQAETTTVGAGDVSEFSCFQTHLVPSP